MTASTMTCREFVQRLGAYTDGELDAKQRTDMETHESGCQQCAEYRKSYAMTIKLAKDSARDDDSKAAAELSEALMRSILASRKH